MARSNAVDIVIIKLAKNQCHHITDAKSLHKRDAVRVITIFSQLSDTCVQWSCLFYGLSGSDVPSVVDGTPHLFHQVPSPSQYQIMLVCDRNKATNNLCKGCDTAVPTWELNPWPPDCSPMRYHWATNMYNYMWENAPQYAYLTIRGLACDPAFWPFDLWPQTLISSSFSPTAPKL